MEDNSRIIDEFVEVSLVNWNAELNGNSTEHRRSLATLDSIYKRLKKNNQMHILEPLLSHDNPSVRYHAAFNLIPVRPNEARKVIEELISLKKYWVSLHAEMTIRLWDKKILWILKEK